MINKNYSQISYLNCSCCGASPCCGGGTFNYGNSLIKLYFSYWKAKTSIEHDPKNYVKKIYGTLNRKVMEQGVVGVLFDYGFGLTIAQIVQPFYDKNEQLIAAEVSIKKINNDIKRFKLVHYSVPKNEVYYKELKKTLGWEKAIIHVGTFFKNNDNYDPSLYCLWYQIHKLSALGEISNKDMEIMNVIYQAKSNKKLEEKQLENFGITISSDKKGVLVTEIKNDDAKTTSDRLDIDYVNGSLSKSDVIDNSIFKWTDNFLDFAGIAKEKISADRENLVETNSRNARVDSIEKEHFLARREFIDEVNEYFNLVGTADEIKLTINSLTNTTLNREIFEYDTKKEDEGDELILEKEENKDERIEEAPNSE